MSFALGFGWLCVVPATWAWPDLQVVKTGPAQAAPGGILTYTLRYTNAGPVKSTGVVLNDFLPDHLTVLTNTVTNSGSISNRTVSWSLGTVNSRASGSRSFQVQVNVDASAGLSLTNRAYIVGKEAEETGKTNNNQSLWITRITNGPPVAQNDLYALTENSTLTIAAPGILANDSDPEGHSLTVTLVSGPAHGVLTLQPDGSFTYQPVTDYVGEDSYTYRANDGQFDSAVATVTLKVLPCYPALDVMLVIDRSGSMKGQPYNDARTACSNFVQNFHFVPDADQIGLVSYNSSATLDQRLTNNLEALKLAINAIPAAEGYTSITLGLQTAQNELASARHNPAALPVMLLLSDGLPTGSDSASNALSAARQAKNAGTRVFTVGLGNVDHALMTGLASFPNDYFHTTNSSDLTALFQAISTILCRPPTNIFTAGPSNLTLCPGETATFTVTASGCDVFSFQWTKDGAPLSGQTNSVLVIPGVSANDAGSYAVEVRSPCQSVTNTASLTVSANVTAAGPLSQTRCTGDTVTFTTVAGGTGPYSYQWFKDGGPLPDRTDANLTLSALSTNDAGDYSVVVNGACGGPLTNTASLTVTPPPIIVSRGDKTVEAGTPWTFDDPTANYPIVVVSTVTNAGCGNTLSATRVWRTTDPCGNLADARQTVTVVDTTAPTLTCAANKTVECGSIWMFDAPSATDNGGNPTLIVVNTLTNAGCGNTLSATRTWRATDACGNSAECSQIVTVVDTTPPAIACVTSKTVEAGTPWTFDPPTASDGCGTATIALVGTLTNAGCGNTFSATRTWRATDACGNSAECSQTVTVVDTTAPALTCAANKTVECGSAWTFDTPNATDAGGAPTVIVVSTLTNAGCGNTFSATRTWRATDACGNSAECRQTVTVMDTTPPTIACVANKTVEAGTPWTFDQPTASDGCGTATIALVGTLTNAGCGNTFSATRTWRATDACGNSAECSQTVTVVDTTPPTVSIVSPTNDAIFIAPADITVLANAADTDGTIAAVEFFEGQKLFGAAADGSPYFVSTNGLAAGDYTFTTRATDGCGNASTSAPVRIHVIERPPLSMVSALQFSPQTGYFVQTVRVFNPTYSEYQAVRVYVQNLTNAPAITVHNASGLADGVPYVETHTRVLPGTHVDVKIEYYSPLTVKPNPILRPELVPLANGGAAALFGVGQPIARSLLLPSRNFMVEFASQSNRVYYVQYSRDLVTWKASRPAIQGNGNWIQWIDNGQPKTESAPASESARFYRVILLP